MFKWNELIIKKETTSERETRGVSVRVKTVREGKEGLSSYFGAENPSAESLQEEGEQQKEHFR